MYQQNSLLSFWFTFMTLNELFEKNILLSQLQFYNLNNKLNYVIFLKFIMNFFGKIFYIYILKTIKDKVVTDYHS